MDSIKGAIVLRDRLGDSTLDEERATVPPEAPAIYHWIAVAPAEPSSPTSDSKPPVT